MIGELCACTIIAAVSHIRDKFQADVKSDYNCFKVTKKFVLRIINCF